MIFFLSFILNFVCLLTLAGQPLNYSYNLLLWQKEVHVETQPAKQAFPFKQEVLLCSFGSTYCPKAGTRGEKSDKEGGGVEKRESFSSLTHTFPPPPLLLFFLFFCFCFVCFFRFAFQPSRNNSSRERGAGSVVLVSIT